MLLRINDPSVLWPLMALLTAPQRAALLGPVEHWWILDPAGHPVHLQRPQEVTAEDLRLSEDQWADVLSLNAFNAAMNQWLAACEELPDPQTVASKGGDALTALRRARAKGLNHKDDLTAFAALALLVHPEFDRHPLIRDALAESRSSQRRSGPLITARLAEFSSEHWRSIRQGEWVSSADAAH
jgi:hypothetical protein